MKKQKKLHPADLAVLCSEYAMILRSGIPLYDGIAILSQSAQDTPSRPLLEHIQADMQQGASLYEALADTGQFPAYMLEMIRLAEQTGTLETILEDLSAYYERIARYNDALRSAVVYPVTLIIMMSVVIAVLVVKVIPVFVTVYENLGIELTESASMIMNAGLVIGYAVMAGAILISIGCLALMIAWKQGKEEQILRRAAGIFLFIRRIMEKQAAATYASVISIALKSGYSIEEMTESAARYMPDERSRARAEHAGRAMMESGSFCHAARQTGFYEPIHERMIEVAERTGQTGQVMERLALLYEQQTIERLEAAVSNVEPILIGILTFIAGGILLAVMIPLAGILLAMS